MRTLLTITTVTLIAIALAEILLLIRLRYDNLVNKVWRACHTKSTGQVFTSEMIADLPEPVQKYFLHAIAPGTPLANCVELEMSGTFRPQPDANWLPMTASQIVSTVPGFVWQAKIGQGLTRLSGADYSHHYQGRMRFSLWGLIPVVDAQNPDIDRSGIGRLAGEYSLLPSALLPQNGVTWKAIDDNTIQASFKLSNEAIALTLTIDTEGKLLKMSFLRWGDRTKDRHWQYIPFGEEIQEEKTFGGYTIPAQINAGWWFEQSNYFEFFRTNIKQAQFC